MTELTMEEKRNILREMDADAFDDVWSAIKGAGDDHDDREAINNISEAVFVAAEESGLSVMICMNAVSLAATYGITYSALIGYLKLEQEFKFHVDELKEWWGRLEFAEALEFVNVQHERVTSTIDGFVVAYLWPKYCTENNETLALPDLGELV